MIRRYVFVPNNNTPFNLKKEGVNIDIFEGQEQLLAILEIADTVENKQAIFDEINQPIFLQRIYEKEQKNEYSPSEGQLKTKLGAKKRFLSHLLLQESQELIEEYIKIHGIEMAWPEITQNMITVGVLDMELYLDGYNAFLLMDTKPDFDMEEAGKIWSELPREQEWQAFVSKYQRSDPTEKSTEKWKLMNLVNVE